MEGESLKAVVLATTLALSGWSSYMNWAWWGGSRLDIDPNAISVAAVYYLLDDGGPLVRAPCPRWHACLSAWSMRMRELCVRRPASRC